MNKSKLHIRLFAVIILILVYSCREPRELMMVQSSLITVSHEYNTDLVMDAFLKPYRDSLNQTMDIVIGNSPAMLSKGEPEGQLGNLLCDLMLDYASLNNLHADFSLINNGGIRSFLPAGEITVRNIFEIMPFDNEVVILTLSKPQLLQLFERIASEADMSFGGLQLLIMDKKVVKWEKYIKNVSNDSFFTLITSGYLADGGDQMPILTTAMQRSNLNILLRDLFIRMIEYRTRNNIPLTPQPYVRVKIN